MSDLGIPDISDATLIASGGSALVYRATTTAGTAVAVKLMRGIRGAEVSRRFEREQEAAARLQDHPNIIEVFSSGVTEAGEPYLIMPLLERGSLAHELDHGPFTLDQAVADVVAASAAIDYAHERGVLHRDIKPGNVLRADDDSIVVTDFGIARVVDAGITSATIGASTPLYAAPELLSDNEASVQSEIYSLAALLYALLNGEPAFATGDNIWATIRRVRTEALPPIASVPAPVMRVIEQAMDKDPARRPPTVDQFRLNLLAALDAPTDWYPPGSGEVTAPIPPRAPSVPVVTAPPTPSLAPTTPLAPTPPLAAAGSQAPAAPAASDRSFGAGAKIAASLAALLLIGGLGWLGFSQTLGSDSTATVPVDGEPAGPIDTSLPPLTPRPQTDAPATSPDGVDPAQPDEPTPEPTEVPTATPEPEPTVTDRLVSFNGDHFIAYFPEGFSVIRSDVDVEYGFRSQFIADDIYLNIDTTPSELRPGGIDIASSAREIASNIASASPVETETLEGRELHWFTFRNNRGVPSIDVFFEVDGDGYAIVAGSATQAETAFEVAKQVALTVRSS